MVRQNTCARLEVKYTRESLPGVGISMTRSMLSRIVRVPEKNSSAGWQPASASPPMAASAAKNARREMARGMDAGCAGAMNRGPTEGDSCT